MRKGLWFGYVITVLCILTIACGPAQPQLKKLPPDGVILAVGDSLTYGVGASQDTNYPSVLARLINHKVINAGVSGAESKDILQTLPGLIQQHQPQLIILMIGGNDMIRKRPHADIKANIQQMIAIIQKSGIQMILIAEPSPSLRPQAPAFYHALAAEAKIPLDNDTVPGLLRDNQYKSDYIHLNQAGYAELAQKIANLLQKSGAL